MKMIEGLEAPLLRCLSNILESPAGDQAGEPLGNFLFSQGLHLSIWELGLVPALLPY